MNPNFIVNSISIHRFVRKFSTCDDKSQLPFSFYRIKESDVGWYKCFAYNEYGEAQQRIRLAISEYPRVIENLKETFIRAHSAGKLMCRISGVPPCNVKWFKDWQEIEPSIKYKVNTGAGICSH